MGFFPLVSTVALFKRFSPLKNYLAERMGREITLETAKDFPTFVQRTAERRYDILVTAPHFAVRAVDSGEYRIVASSTKDVQVLLVVREDSPLAEPGLLAGKTVATPPATALMTMIGKDYMKQQGLGGEHLPRYRAFKSHNAANQAVVSGEVDAAIASSNIVYKSIDRGMPLRVVGRGLKLPNMATLVATDLPPEVAEDLLRVVQGMGKDPVGRHVLKVIGLPEYKAAAAADYEVVRPYAYTAGKKP